MYIEVEKTKRSEKMNPSTSTEKQRSLRRSLTAAEFCGGTTADFAALCCCGPCSVVSLVVLAVYKLPRGICRRAIRRVRRRRLEKKECEKKKLSKVGSSKFAVHPVGSRDGDDEDEEDLDKLAMEMKDGGRGGEEDEEVVALEEEMWSRFYGGGFWRSLSGVETASLG